MRSPGFDLKSNDIIYSTVRAKTTPTIRFGYAVEYQDGRVDSFQVDVQGAGDRSAVSQKIIVADNLTLYGADCRWLTGSAITGPGQVFVHSEVYRNGVPVAFVMAGYIYNAHVPGFPGAFQGPLDGPGDIVRAALAATPITAAGKVLAAVPTAAAWRRIAGHCAYAASATAGTRNVQVRFRDASGNIFKRCFQMGPTANQTGEVEWARNRGVTETRILAGNAGVQDIAPEYRALAGYDVFVIDAANIDGAADTVALEEQVEEWISP